MAVSKRIEQMMTQSSWIRRMFETGSKLKKEFGAENVYDFSLGNPNIDPPPEFQRVLEQVVAQKTEMKHGYMPNAGYPDVRAKIAAFISSDQGVNMDADHLVMTSGAGGAMNVALKTILNPGDQVLVCTPCFMEYKFYVDNHGGELVMVPGTEDFDLSVENLEKAVTEKTAAVIVNSPNNPTGRIYPEATIKALAAMLERKSGEIGRRIYIVSDEPYRKIVYGNRTVPSLLKIYPHTLSSTSYSKDLSLPGERIGWLALNPLADDAANIMGGLVLCNRILGYVNAPALMQRVVGELQGVTVDMTRYISNKDLLSSSLREMGYDFMEPEGTFYLFIKAPDGDDLRAVAALQEEKILTVPGRGFGCPGYFRIAFCVTGEMIKRSLPGFRNALRNMQ